MSERSRPFIRMIIACFFFLTAVALNILLPRYWHNVPEIVKHLLLIFSAIMCVHIMEYAYLWWEIFGHIRGILKETLQDTDHLINQNRNLLENFLQSTNRLIGSAASCGLTNIYCSRKEVKGDIYDAIEKAEKRVWLLGITLSENIHLDELLSTLDTKIANGLDVKILLLDVLRGPAVFRTFFESTAPEAAKIINADRTKTQVTDPYFHQRIYSDFTHACDRLQSYSKVGATVRFYTHTPACWMMIVDNTAHFQPYTFGRSASHYSTSQCLGALMPVFKFQMQPNGKPFEILEDNFLKLWLTSNIDLFHVEARIADRNRIVKGIFNSHLPWFKHIYSVLHAPKGNGPPMFDRRKFPRQTWEWKQTSLGIRLQDSETTLNATVCDYSCEGMSLKFEKETPHGLNEEQTVILQNILSVEPSAASFIIDHFLRIKNFKVKRIVKESQPIIGLQASLEDERSSEPLHNG